MPRRCVAYGCPNTYESRNSETRVRLFSFPKDTYYRRIWIKKVRQDRQDINWTATVASCLCSEHFERTCQNFYPEYIRRESEGLPDRAKTKLKSTAIPTIFGNSLNTGSSSPNGEKQGRQQGSGISATWGIVIPKASFLESLKQENIEFGTENFRLRNTTEYHMQEGFDNSQMNIIVPDSIEIQEQPKMSEKKLSYLPTTKSISVGEVKSEQEILQNKSCEPGKAALKEAIDYLQSILDRSSCVSTSTGYADLNSCVIKKEPEEVMNNFENVNNPCQESREDFSMQVECTDLSRPTSIHAIKQEIVQPELSSDEYYSSALLVSADITSSTFEPANAEIHVKIEVVDSEVLTGDNVSESDSTSEEAVLRSPSCVLPAVKFESQELENNCFSMTEEAAKLDSVKPKCELCVISQSSESCSHSLVSKKSATCSNSTVTISTNENAHICIYCKQSFQTKLALSSHHPCNSQEKLYPCPRCEKIFKRRSALKQHFASHSEEKPYFCRLCKKAFKQKRILMQHLARHSDEKYHACNHCQKSFKTNSELRLHLSVHSKERPYSCEHCQKTFKRKSLLQRHLSSHSEERPHCCDHCKKTYKTKRELVVHLSRHTDERPHLCDHCDKAFKTKLELMRHLSRHSEERPYYCEHCGRAFVTKAELVIHLSSHSAQRPHSCRQCEKSFKTKIHLVRHLLRHRRKRSNFCDQ